MPELAGTTLHCAAMGVQAVMWGCVVGCTAQEAWADW